MNVKRGEEVCSNCKGLGYISFSDGMKAFCLDCKGTGKIDWIEKATGKEFRKQSDTEMSKYFKNHIEESMKHAVKLWNEEKEKSLTDIVLDKLKDKVEDGYIVSFTDPRLSTVGEDKVVINFGFKVSHLYDDIVNMSVRVNYKDGDTAELVGVWDS